jgi:SAM-dependent methyltransferase
MINETFDYVEYLRLKKAIDDRSLNPLVWQALNDWIEQKSSGQKHVRILEIGAGTGTMIGRLLDSIFPFSADYTALEPEKAFKVAAREQLEQWAADRGLGFTETAAGTWQINKSDKCLELEWLSIAAEHLGTVIEEGSLDLLLAHAVVDLLPVPVLLPKLLDLLKPGGAFYFSLNYSGTTRFEPAHRDDVSLMQAYNQDMDAKFVDLDWQASLTGIRLGSWLTAEGYQVVAEADSDWQLNSADGVFVRNILDTMKKALQRMKELPPWYDTRAAQLEAGSLVLRISNTDIFGLKANEVKQ